MVHAGRAVAERIGRVGVWTFRLDEMTSVEARGVARRFEEMGAGALWIPESVVSKEVFAHSTLLLSWTERLPVAPGIANIWARDPVAMANGARTLAEAFPGRFVLGLGVSHEPAVRRPGGGYERPPARGASVLRAGRARAVRPERARPGSAAGRRAGRRVRDRPVGGARDRAGPHEGVPQARQLREQPAAARLGRGRHHGTERPARYHEPDPRRAGGLGSRTCGG